MGGFCLGGRVVGPSSGIAATGPLESPNMRFVLIYVFVPLLLLKQVLINGLGGQRHPVAGAVFLVAAFLVYSAVIAVLVRRSRGSRVLHLPYRGVLLVHLALLSYWTLLLVLPSGGNWVQRLVAWSYTGLFTMMIWVPAVFLTSRRDVQRMLLTLSVMSSLVGLIGVLQWYVPEDGLPFLLLSDHTVSLSATVFGTTRVNGLLGTPLEFSLLMAMMGLLSYVKLGRRLSIPDLGMLMVALTGVTFAASRAYWLVTALVYGSLSLVLNRRLLLLIIAYVVFMSITVLPSGYFLGTFFTSDPSYGASVNTKISEMFAAILEVRSSPLVGIGLGFQIAPSFGDASRKIVYDGFWWALLLEGGIVGLLLVWTFLASLSRVLVLELRKDRGGSLPLSRQLETWGLGTIAIAVIGNITNSSLNNQVVNLVFFLLLGTVLASINLRYREASLEMAEGPGAPGRFAEKS